MPGSEQARVRVRRRRRTGSISRRRRLGLILRLLVAAVAVVFALFPVLWVISASFNPTGNLATQQLIPRNPWTINYQNLLTNPLTPCGSWLLNSLTVTVLSSVLGLISIMISAYSF